MCRHPSVAWLSSISDRHPDKPALGRFLMRLIDFPAVGELVSWYVDPGECYQFWDYHYRGFSMPCRDLVAGDATPDVVARVPAYLNQMTTAARARPLLKITGWPRLGFLNEVFPDALFIHVLRDGRAVANSFLKVDWWRGWRGPGNWRWGDLSSSHQQEWNRHDRSFVALAAIQWKIFMDAMEVAKRSVPAERLLEVRYEDVCADPLKLFRQATDFTGLEWSSGFEEVVRRRGLRSENDKWRRDFTPRQQAILEDVLGPYLLRYGYR
jgi:hypothetical protein